jgi:hypothetical protein
MGRDTYPLALSGCCESGTREDRRADGSDARTTPVARQARSLEGYLRVGGVIER